MQRVQAIWPIFLNAIQTLAMELGQCSKNTHILPFLEVIIVALLLFLLSSHAAPLVFNYPLFHEEEDALNFDGDVYYDNGFLQLTKYEKDSAGRVTYYKQLHLWDRESRKLTDFTTRFSFIINAPNKTYHGDGITFFLASPNFPLPVPPDGTGIGLVSREQMQDPNYPNEHPFVAVEFDTYWNKYDPKYDHVGVDIKSVRTPYTTQWFSILDGRKYDAEVSYNSSSHNLTIIFTGYKDNVTIKQDYSHVVDLREVLPEWVEFGFSSATGILYEIHTLCSWSFNSSLNLEKHEDEKKTRLVIGISIGAGVLIVGFGLGWLVMWKLGGKRREDGLDFNMDNDFERGTSPRKFSYKEIAKATNNFAEEKKLGEGGFGSVYKGFIKDLNSHVAVKKVSRGSKQGVKEYASEVTIISQLRHKNLVQLIGWCHEKSDLMLIYELMENGSLDSHLFRGKSLLTWETRYNIARGLASALLYLHEEWEQCVVHRDIKPSNIMLDSNFNVKLGDFGLARLLDHGKDYKTTVLAGTLGYIAPEATRKGKASKESDVYSFGIVALEIASGRRPVEPNAKEEEVILVEWIWELHGKGDLLKAADPRLCGEFDEQEMNRLMMVGLWCVHQDYTLRPSIRRVVQALNFEVPMPTIPARITEPIYIAPSGSAFSSSISSGDTAFEINEKRPSSHSFYTGSSQSSSSSAFLSAVPHTT